MIHKIINENKQLGNFINFEFNNLIRKERNLLDFKAALIFIIFFSIPHCLLFGWKGFASDLWDISSPIVIATIITSSMLLILTIFCQILNGFLREICLYIILISILVLFGILCGKQIANSSGGYVSFSSLGFALAEVIILLIIFTVVIFFIRKVIYRNVKNHVFIAMNNTLNTVKAIDDYKKVIRIKPEKIFGVFILMFAIFLLYNIPSQFEKDVIARKKYIKNLLKINDEEFSLKLQRKIIVNTQEYDNTVIKELVNNLIKMVLSAKNYRNRYIISVPKIIPLKIEEEKTKPSITPIRKRHYITPQLPSSDPFSEVFAFNIPNQKLDIPSQRERIKIMIKKSEQIMNESYEEILNENNLHDEQELIDVLKTYKDYKIRQAIVYKLESFGSEKVIDVLIEVLNEESKISIPCIGDNLSDFDKQPKNKMEQNENEGMCQLSAKAAKVLGKLGYYLKFYEISKIKNENLSIAINEMNEKRKEQLCGKIVNALQKTLEKSKHAQIRWHSAEALGVIKSKQSIELLITTLNEDNSEAVREYAAEALGKNFSNKNIEQLLNAFKTETNESVLEAIIESIASISRVLLTAQKNLKSKIKKEEIFSEDIILNLKKIVIEEEDIQKRALVIWGLGQIGLEEIVPFLEKITEDENEDLLIKETAKKAINETIKFIAVSKFIDSVRSGDINL